MSKLGQPNPSLSEARPFAAMSRVNPHAAGVDFGAHEIMVCVPDDESTQPVRFFGNDTADLQTIAAWLKEHHIEAVAMDSTGIYWIPLFETLVATGVRCCLVSARSLRRVPECTSDVFDFQWVQTVHRYGLLKHSFRRRRGFSHTLGLCLWRIVSADESPYDPSLGSSSHGASHSPRLLPQVIKDKVEYQPLSVEEYETRYRRQQVRYFQKKAIRLGFQLTPA